MSTSLWLGDVGPNWDESLVRPWLSQLPGFVSVKLMTRTGYGFIDFTSHELALSAMNLLQGHANPLYGGVIRLRWAASKGGEGGGAIGGEAGPRIQGVMGGQPGGRRDADASAFVGGLGPDTDESAVLQLFQGRFASVTGARIVRDATGRSKGYGFVRFGDPAEQAAAVAELNGAYIGGQPIRVSGANSKTTGAGGAPPGAGGAAPAQAFGQQAYTQQGYGQGYPAGQGYGVQGMGPMGGAQPIMSGLPFAAPPAPEEGNTTIFIGNVDPSVDESTIFTTFVSIGPVSSVSIPRGRACAFVQYQFYAHAEAAVRTMNGLQLAGQTLRCSFGKNQMRASAGASHARPLGAALIVGPGAVVQPTTGLPGSMYGSSSYPLPAHMTAGGMPMQYGASAYGSTFGAGLGSGLGVQGMPLQASAPTIAGIDVNMSLPGLHGGVGMGMGVAAGAGEASSSALGADMDGVRLPGETNAVPEDIRQAFGAHSVADTGEMTKQFQAEAANEAFSMMAAALMLGSGPASTLLVAAFTRSETPEAGSVIRHL